jgi:alkanesulfonate monooxygenase SsuD/methylene tetrahydromethanopterin reductase-like flavin-dependent oxidoreductase (luciferase family)
MASSFGVKLPGLVPGFIPEVADISDFVVELEKLGVDDVMDGEHLLHGPDMPHPGGSGTMVHGRTEKHSDRCDTIVTFATIAAKTTKIKMISGIILAAAHPFALLARQAATLDVLSKGRFMLGVGKGWYTTEMKAMGIPLKERDDRAEETIRACLELWSPGLSSFEGKWISFHDVLTEPAPYSEGGVPVWWGGNAVEGPTARRVAEFCQGWISREAASYDELARSIEHIVEECNKIGRDPTTVGFRASVVPTRGHESYHHAEVIDIALATQQKLEPLGVRHFNIPLNYFEGYDLEDLGTLLSALRSNSVSV